MQLHGYQTPGFVGAVKSIAPDVRVIKVLHVRGGKCVEERLIGAYEKAGVDVFLFDAVAEDGRVGSTGQTLDADLVASLAEGLTRPFLLAGGISAENRERYAALAAHPRFLGIDVDTNARGRRRQGQRGERRGDLPGLEGACRRRSACLAVSSTRSSRRRLPVIMEVKRQDGERRRADGRADDPGDRRRVRRRRRAVHLGRDRPLVRRRRPDAARRRAGSPTCRS